MRLLSKWPFMKEVMKEGESKKAPLNLMKHSHFDRALRKKKHWKKMNEVFWKIQLSRSLCNFRGLGGVSLVYE